MRKLIFDPPSLIVGKDKDNYIWKYGKYVVCHQTAIPTNGANAINEIPNAPCNLESITI
jgi:hypothetical protein